MLVKQQLTVFSSVNPGRTGPPRQLDEQNAKAPHFCTKWGLLRPLELLAVRSGLGQIRFGRRLAGSGEGEHRVLAGAFAVPVVDVDGDDLSRPDLLEEDLLRELVLDLTLDGAPQRPSTQHRVEATLGQQ